MCLHHTDFTQTSININQSIFQVIYFNESLEMQKPIYLCLCLMRKCKIQIYKFNKIKKKPCYYRNQCYFGIILICKSMSFSKAIMQHNIFTKPFQVKDKVFYGIEKIYMDFGLVQKTTTI